VGGGWGSSSSSSLHERGGGDGDGVGRRRRRLRRPYVETTTTTTTTASRRATVASQAALVAGTTIGGGFLALPAATAPCGAAPAALGLFGVWLFLLGSALSLSNAIFAMGGGGGKTIGTSRGGEGEGGGRGEGISLSSLIRECFGGTAGRLGGLLFLMLTTTTLVAQLSKAGTMLDMAFPTIDRRVSTCLFSSSVSFLCLSCRGRGIERVNDALTFAMVCSFASLVALAGAGGWTPKGLRRADFRSLLPSLSSSGRPWAIPIFIQLLIYNEMVPLVASRLNDEGEVRRAILFGSSIPLLMCLIWSGVSLGLVPYESSLTTMMTSGGAVYDPLGRLGDVVSSSGGGSIGRVFLASVNVLAGTAICTTVIGSILASAQYYEGAIPKFPARLIRGSNDVGEAKSDGGDDDDRTNFVRRVIIHTLAIAPSSLIALRGSGDLYYRATSFAGEFPCTLLYGLIPPLCNLRLRWKHRNRREGASRWIDAASQMIIALISLSILIVGNISKINYF
jgi:tyrosine-specific transport protein